MTEPLELAAQLDEVVDLAVEHNRISAVLADQRLIAPRCEIDDREPSVGEANHCRFLPGGRPAAVPASRQTPVGRHSQIPMAVRATMTDRPSHRSEARGVTPGDTQEPGDPAHGQAPKWASPVTLLLKLMVSLRLHPRNS